MYLYIWYVKKHDFIKRQRMNKSVESTKGQSVPIMVSSKTKLFSKNIFRERFALLLFFIIITEDLTL